MDKPAEKHPSKIFSSLHSGQALLIVLLTMSVILTVVLSVVSRSVTNISTSVYEEEALRAFSAAEAGVEKALINGSGSGGAVSIDTNVTYDTSVSSPTGTDDFVYPHDILSGESATFWFVSHDANGNLTCSSADCLRAASLRVCFGDAGTPPNQADTPAVEIAVLYDTTQSGVSSSNFADVTAARVAYDPNPGRRVSNNFLAAQSDCTIGSETFAFETPGISLTPAGLDIPCNNTAGCLLMARVRLYYNSASAHPVGLIVSSTGGTVLPAQGTRIESTGVAGDSTRKVSVFRGYPEPPSIFDSAVFSLTDFSKN